MNENINFDETLLSNDRFLISLNIASENLKEFNKRIGKSQSLDYNSNLGKFQRSDAHIPPYFGNYFDDYCLLIINWLDGLYEYSHITDRWVGNKTLVHRLLNEFNERNLYKTDEVKLFTTLFENFVPYAPFLTEEHKQQLKSDINATVTVVKNHPAP